MATSIDNRIVKMDFQNSNFVKAAQTTMRTLGDLTKSLKLTEGTKAFSDVASAAKNVNLEPVASGVTKLRDQFSALDVVGVTALVNITNKAVSAGVAFGKSLTVDPILDGLREYETKMNAIQTILTNTASKGTTLDDINVALGELNEYSDQTIYNFAQMTDNIGKATAAGVGLDDAVVFVKGMANAAAGFGVDAMAMAGATQQMTQALASGTVRLQDWVSMENRGLGGEMLQNAMIETARDMGIYVDTSEGFRYSLEDNWLSAEVFIETMRKMADDPSLVSAATNVKTFTQLMGVMKESVGSGWAVSWEHIIGNKEESTKLFTNISNGFSTISGAMADYRNNALATWKSLGGRDDVLRGLFWIFDSISNVLGPIYEAFKKVFDPWNGRALASLSEGFKDLMFNLRITEATGEKIGKTFEGIFSIFKLAATLFKPILSFIEGLLGSGGSLVDMFFSGTASIGEWVTAATGWIENSSFMAKTMEFMAEAGTAMGDGLKAVFNSITDDIETASDLIAGWTAGVGAWLADVGGGVGKFISKCVDSIAKFIDGVKGVEGSVGIFGKIGKAIGDIFDGTGDVFDKIVNVMGDFIDFLIDGVGKIQELFSHFSGIIKDAISVGVVGVIGYGAKKVFDFIKQLGEGFGAPMEIFKRTLSQIPDSLEAVRDSLEAYQKSLKADVIIKLATAIGILAVSIFLLSKIEPDRLLPATAALIAVGAGLTTLLKIMENYDPTSFSSSAGMFIAAIGLAIAASILASALKKLTSINWDELGVALVGLGGVLVGLVVLMKVMDSLKTSISPGIGIAIVGIGLGIWAIANSLKIMSGIAWDDMVRGLIQLGGVLLSVGIFAKLIKGSGGDLLVASVGLGVLAGALAAVAGVLVIYSMIDAGQIMYAGTLIGGLMVGIALFAKMAKSWGKDILLASVTMGVLGGALTALAGVIGLYALISWETFLGGLSKMALSLGVLGIALQLFPTGSIKNVLGVIGLAVGITLMTSALQKLADIPWGGIIKGIVALGAMFLVLGGAALLLGPLVPAMLGVAGVLVLVAAGVAVLAGGVALLAMSMTALAAVGAAAAVSLTAVLLALAAVFPVVTAAFALGIVSFITVLGANAPALTNAFVEMIMGICQAVIETAPKVGEAISQLIIAACQAIIDAIPKIAETLVALLEGLVTVLDAMLLTLYEVVTHIVATLVATVIESLLVSIPVLVAGFIQVITAICTAIATEAPKLIGAFVDMIIAIIMAIGENTIKLVNAGLDMIIQFMNGMANTIETRGPQIRAAAGNLAKAIIKEFGRAVGDAANVGKNIIGGLVKGIKNSIGSAISAVKNVASSVWNSAKSFLGIHSPSRKFAELGKYCDEGMAQGLKQNSRKVANQAVGVASETMTSMQRAMAGVNTLFDGVDGAPVIKPIVDLSNVQNGAAQARNMMNSNYRMNVAAEASTGSRAVKSMNHGGVNSSGGNTTNNNNTTEVVNHFTISGAQDPNAVADAVSKIIDKQVKRRGAVWA